MITDTATNTTYKTVPTTFMKKGFCYEQMRRQGNWAIYRQTRPGSDMCNYEVVKIGRHNGYTMGGAWIEPAETYPGSSLWGLCGWTCSDMATAQARFAQCSDA